MFSAALALVVANSPLNSDYEAALAAVVLAVRTGLAAKPRGASWPQIHGVALLCGLGFTMSLFIGEIAFDGDRGLVAQAKLGVLAGSPASIVAGVLPPRRSGDRPP
jgi:Na+:H+ antiporter, NhaA family